MKIVYMATAAIACPVLNRLAASNHEILAVVSQPNAPSGRKRKLTASPVKQRALELEIPVLTPEKIGSEESLAALTELGADLFVVFAYGQYIPASVTDLPRHRSINIHPSLLPKYRGASPIQFTLLNGDPVGGVSIIYVSPEMDAGDVLAQKAVEISEVETTGTLSDKMADAGGALLLEVIEQLASGAAQPVVQDPAGVVETRKLTKADGVIDWSDAALSLRHRVQAFNPWPSCTFTWQDQTIKVHRAQVESGEGAPGTVLDVGSPGPLIATGDGALRLLELQPPGKKPMPADDFLRGRPMQVGEQLGSS